MLKCPSTNSDYVKNGALCDNFESCEGENALCQVSHNTEIISNTVTEINKVKHLSYCLPGFHPRGLLQCTYGEFSNRESVRAGVVHPENLSYPTSRQSCLYVYGELYVYTSCRDMCSELNISCPLRPIKYNACPYSMRNKLYIPSDSQYRFRPADMRDNI